MKIKPTWVFPPANLSATLKPFPEEPIKFIFKEEPVKTTVSKYGFSYTFVWKDGFTQQTRVNAYVSTKRPNEISIGELPEIDNVIPVMSHESIHMALDSVGEHEASVAVDHYMHRAHSAYADSSGLCLYRLPVAKVRRFRLFKKRKPRHNRYMEAYLKGQQ